MWRCFCFRVRKNLANLSNLCLISDFLLFIITDYEQSPVKDHASDEREEKTDEIHGDVDRDSGQYLLIFMFYIWEIVNQISERGLLVFLEWAENFVDEHDEAFLYVYGFIYFLWNRKNCSTLWLRIECAFNKLMVGHFDDSLEHF